MNIRAIENNKIINDEIISCELNINDIVKIINKNYIYHHIYKMNKTLRYMFVFDKFDIKKFYNVPANKKKNHGEGKIVKLFHNDINTIIAIITRGPLYYICIDIKGLKKVNSAKRCK